MLETVIRYTAPSLIQACCLNKGYYGYSAAALLVLNGLRASEEFYLQDEQIQGLGILF